MSAVRSKGSKVGCQWFQTANTVSASLKLRPEASRGKITATFRNNYCAVYYGEELYWEAYLARVVQPDKCKLTTTSHRSEVKLTKAEKVMWDEFEAETPVKADPEISSQSAPPTSNNYVLEDLIFVDHIHHDFYDQHTKVKVKVQVGKVVKSSCKVSFSGRGMEVKFQTRSERFLQMYEDHSRNTFFLWKTQLYGEILPAECSFQVLPNCVEILLHKVSTSRWKTLNPPSQSRDLNNQQGDLSDQQGGVGNSPQGLIGDLNNQRGELNNQRNTNVDELPHHNDLDSDYPPQEGQVQDGVGDQPQGASEDGYSNNLSSAPISGAGEQEGGAVVGSNWNNLNELNFEASLPNAIQQNTTGSENEATPPSSHSPKQEGVMVSNNWNDIDSVPAVVTRSGQTIAIITDNLSHTSLASHERDALTVPSRVAGTAEASLTAPTSISESSSSASSGNAAMSNQITTDHVTPKVLNAANNNIKASANNIANTNNVATSVATPPVPSLSQSNRFSRPSVTGLLNIGNSCFMNSVVQCLSNTAPLRDYFMEGCFRRDINRENPLGFKGHLANCFSDTVCMLWSGDMQYYSLQRLKSIVASRSGHFGGYQQHDSHEFMSYLLDGLHEDLNRIRHKPSTSAVETAGLADSAAAEKAWQVHKKRNDSYFVDNFQGQYKSTLVCPVCQNISVTFDPFMSLSVPLPRNLRRLPIFFVPQDPGVCPRRYVMQLPPDANLELLRASVARKTGISMLQLRMFEIFNNKFHTLLSDNQQPIASIGDNDVIIVSQVLSPVVERQEVVEINVIQRLKIALFPTKCTSCGRHSNTDQKLLRCSKCKAVGYCNRECQGHDWKEHKMKCRKGRPTPVGLPFVISLPVSQFTYAELSSRAEQFARRSVEVIKQPCENPNSILSENPEGIQRENPEGIQSENPESIQSENPESVQSKNPDYVLVPVDRYGDNTGDSVPLEDLGHTLLPFRSQYLAMDWLNDRKGPGSVQIQPKEVMDHEVEGMEGVSPSTRHSSKEVTLDQCIELFTQPETLSKEEAWYCPKCKEHREAIKQISIWKLPPLLIIHLKRFSFSGNYHKDKLKMKVEFPVSGLDMTPFMLGESSTHLAGKAPPIYDLYATVNHYGAVYMGHYIAQVKPPCLQQRDWLLYDDEQVKTIKETEVVDSTAYILFYKHRTS